VFLLALVQYLEQCEPCSPPVFSLPFKRYRVQREGAYDFVSVESIEGPAHVVPNFDTAIELTEEEASKALVTSQYEQFWLWKKHIAEAV
jgi:hypothetical protein